MKLTFRFAITLLTLVFLFNSCGEYPFDDYPPSGLEGFTKIGTASIGAEGGIIDFDSIRIDIPAGAFGEKQKIKIYVQEPDAEVAEYALSSTYMIEGLPEYVNTPLEVRIGFEGDIDGDTLIAMGEMGYASSLNDEGVFAYEGVEATLDGSYAVCELGGNVTPVKSGGNAIKKMLSNQVQLYILQKYTKLMSSKGNFAVIAPKNLVSEGKKLGEYFETAYDTCSAMKFSLDARPWPAYVFFRRLKDADVCGYYASYYSNPTTDQSLRNLFYKGRFTINTQLINDQDELRVTAGHEFLHLVQNLYEFSSPSVEPNQIWLKEATAVWIESKYTTQNDYRSSSITTHEAEPFRTWNFASADHGYGMSFLIKDIAEKYGDQSVVKIHQAIKDGDVPTDPKNPAEALLDQLKEPVSTFYHSVMGAYLLGYYYNKQVIKEVWGDMNVMNEWNIKDDIDTLYRQALQ